MENIQADPAGRGPDWGVVVFTAKNQQPCTAAGRISGGKVGMFRPDGKFAPYPIEDGGSCVDLDAVPAGAQITMGTGSDARTVVHGLAGPKVKSITVETPTGTQELRLGPRRSFLAVLTADTKLSEVAVIAVFRSGESVRLLG